LHYKLYVFVNLILDVLESGLECAAETVNLFAYCLHAETLPATRVFMQFESAVVVVDPVT